jgi:hypothetical protein
MTESIPNSGMQERLKIVETNGIEPSTSCLPDALLQMQCDRKMFALRMLRTKAHCKSVDALHTFLSRFGLLSGEFRDLVWSVFLAAEASLSAARKSADGLLVE